MLRRKKPIDRLILIRWSMIGLFGAAVYSQARLQILDRKHTLLMAEGTHRFTMSKIDPAKRGTIFSADGKPIAENDDTYSLVVQFADVPQSDGFFLDLSAATGIPASEFSQLAASKVTSKTWAQPMSASQQKTLQAVKTKWRANGISIAPSGERQYPIGSAASCIVGISSSSVQLGLEQTLNEALAGKDGKTVGLVDRTGAFLPMRLSKDTIPKQNGKDVELTIDSELQILATAAIRQAVEANKAERGVAVMIDPATGDILAMANWPSFDPTGRDNPPGTVVSDFNACTMSQLEPGSMFKILTLAKALDMGAINASWTGYCSGSKQVSGRTIHCASHEVHHDVNITKAIAESCNVSAAAWALRIGPTEYRKYLQKLEILKKAGLGLPHEKTGNFAFDDPAIELQTALLGFGQAVAVTPIRVASALAMIGNHGVRMEPRLIRRVGNDARPIVNAGQMVKPETAAEVMRCMEAVVQTDAGTGHAMRIPGYRLAGKTGTAERRGGGRSGYVSNFVGFLPAQNPKVMILVMVDHPQNGLTYGAQVAGPVFTILAKAAIRRLGIAPTEPVADLGDRGDLSSKHPNRPSQPAQSAKSPQSPLSPTSTRSPKSSHRPSHNND